MRGRPQETVANATRIEGLKVIGASLEKGLLEHSLPRPLKKLVAGIVERRAGQGYTPDTSQGGVIHRGSGSVFWTKESDPAHPASLFVRTSDTSSYERGKISVSDIADGLEMTLAHRSGFRGEHSPSPRAAWIVTLEQHPADSAWLKGIGKKQKQAISDALAQERGSTWIIKATNYLEFDANGEFLGANTTTRHWDVARPR